jgi:hypothetical protein
MSNIRVTLKVEPTGEERTVQLPTEMPVGRAVAALVGELHLPAGDYVLRRQTDSQKLSPTLPLGKAGVEAGARLVLAPAQGQGIAAALISFFMGLISGLIMWLVVFIAPQINGRFWAYSWGAGQAVVIPAAIGVALGIAGMRSGSRAVRALAIAGLVFNIIGLANGIIWAVLSGVTWIVRY